VVEPGVPGSANECVGQPVGRVFEGLREQIGTDPAKDPDFGPRRIHESAGATAVGARPFLVAYKSPDPEKLSAYECGFNAFDDARMKFDVRFYLVAILFIIFDLEVTFLFPWAVVYGQLGVYGFWSMMVFLGVLTIGFAYEWKKGALEWD